MRPVFVAGRGAVSGYGSGRAALADGVFGGERAVRPRDRTGGFEASTHVAAEAPAACFAGAESEADFAFVIARDAAREALAEAGDPDPGRLGFVLATTKGDMSGLDGAGVGFGLPARIAARLAASLGVARVCGALSCGCASGLSAVGLAARRIALGEEERVIVASVDVLCEFIIAGFGGLHALDPDPCRPFDMNRRGISLGDGAAAVVLSAHESESIGVRVAGLGQANDACHVTGPDRQGAGLRLASARALERAGIGPADVDFVHLHGTGTLKNDISEALGLVGLFGGRTAPAFGTKAQTGHTLGAAGLVESIVAIEALLRGRVPRNVGLQEPGVDPGLQLVRETIDMPAARRALKVSAGFGGVQAAAVFER